MAITATNLKNRLGAGRYYQLAFEQLPNWATITTYSTDDRVNALNDTYSGSISVYTAYKSLTDSNQGNDPDSDSVNWVEYSEAAEQAITRADLFVKAFVQGNNHTYDLTDELQAEAVLLMAIAYLIDYSNQMSNADADESASIDEKQSAMDILNNAFSLKKEDQPKQPAFCYVSNSNATVRRLQDVDTERYYNKNYDTNDLESDDNS